LTLTQRLPTTLLIAITTLGAAYVVLLASGSGALDVPILRQIYIAMAAAVILPWLAFAVVRPAWRPSSQLAPALVAVLAAFAISSIFSRVPRLSFEMLAYGFLLVEVYLFLVGVMRRPVLRAHFQRLALLLCIVVCGYYLWEVFQLWITWWDLVGRFTLPPLRPLYAGLFTGPNPVATAALTFGAFGLTALDYRRVAGRVAAAVVIALVLVTTFITGSRGAWLGAAIGIAVAVATLLAVEPAARARLSAVLRSRLGIAAAIGGTVLLAAAAAVAALTGRLTLEGGSYRDGFSYASLRMFESSRLTGVGPGIWGTLRAANTPPEYPDLYIPHAHSVYFQTLAEFGLVGVAAGIAVLGALGLLIIRAVRAPDVKRRMVGFAALFGVLLLAGQQYPDMLMNVPIVLLAVSLPVAWLDATAQPPPDQVAPAEPRSRPGMSLRLATALAVTTTALVGLFRSEAVANVANDGVIEANLGNWQRASEMSRQAAADDPDLALYWFQLGVAAANAGDLETAEAALTRSTAADDYRYAWLDLAAVRWARSDANGAREALIRAERLGLQRTALAVAAGWLRQQLGDDQAATSDYAIAVWQMPSLAADPFWESADGPRGGLAPILEAVATIAPLEPRLEVALALEREDDARHIAAELAPTDPTLWPLVVPAWQGDESALETLHELASQQPLEAPAAYWSRAIAAYRGDKAAAARYGFWLAVMHSPDFALPPLGRLSFGTAEALPNYVLDGYGSLYRRQIPRDQVVALLPQVVLEGYP
jgi:O-antigen ligase/tetratricopeptide (TPR) repeat protein